MKYKKTSKQMKGYGLFKYCIQFGWSDSQGFSDVRTWCWEQWGPSNEVDLCLDIGINPKWGWVYDRYTKRVYLEDDAQLSRFIMKWKI
jgi:hypothetical protein